MTNDCCDTVPYFSIVVPTYQRAEKLKRTIESVLNQTFGDFELLVMDDGSSDNTRFVVESYGDARIRYSWAPNSGGPATPRNRGIDAAKSDWICLLDADDVWYPRKLETVAQVIERHPDCAAVCHDEILNVLATGQKSLLHHGPYQEDFYRAMLTGGNRVSTSAVTLRKSFLDRYRLRFNPANDYIIVEDFDLWLRIALHGGVFEFVPDVLGEYIIEDDNLTGNFRRYQKNLTSLLRDHVFIHQTFEENKEALWRDLNAGLKIQELKEYFVRKKYSLGARTALTMAIGAPLETGKTVARAIRRRYRRMRRVASR